MTNKETFRTKDNCTLSIEKELAENSTTIKLFLEERRKVVLHWGICKNRHNDWQIPAESFWPKQTHLFKTSALQTAFTHEGGKLSISLHLPQKPEYRWISFSLFYPDENRWDNNHNKNFTTKLPVPQGSGLLPTDYLKKSTRGKTLFEEEYTVDGETMAIMLIQNGDTYTLRLATTLPDKIALHWGVAKKTSRDWQLPSLEIWPQGTVAVDDKAAQTPFSWVEGMNQLTIPIKAAEDILGVPFVLRIPEGERWIKNKKRNFYAPLRQKKTSDNDSSFPAHLHDTADIILNAEMEHGSWTLMHRFNLCHDLLEGVQGQRDSLALLFVWLRYSATRQLDWQRNYNTQPRELAHAQDRLTLKIAEQYIQSKENRDLLRLIFTTLGPGGEGQKIRDEILHIMHRHHIKEVSGRFMEEWHQKLHNNTTPDDIIICEAYIEFLKSDGNLDRFYGTLQKGGVTKERLASFERPIVTQPDFVPHIKDGLIHDFTNYLKLFKSVHSGADLEGSIERARQYLDHQANEALSSIWHHRIDRGMPLVDRIHQITSLRNILKNILDHDQNTEKIRTLLYLDLAMEELVRAIIEGNIHVKQKKETLVPLLSLSLENVGFDVFDDEFFLVTHQWALFAKKKSTGKEATLYAKSLLDRIKRVIENRIDLYYQIFQEKAEYMGNGFNAEQWTIDLFSEEVLRGRLHVVLSQLIHHLDPVLRKSADLGEWEIVSPGRGNGQLKVFDSLKSIQNEKFDQQTVAIVDVVKGDEEIPEGISAIITPHTIDMVSHVAVRVRNTGILFATCYNSTTIEELKSKQDTEISLETIVTGDVVIGINKKNDTSAPRYKKKSLAKTGKKQPFTSYALGLEELTAGQSGGKSFHLLTLKKQLPKNLLMPKSMVIPFGTLEKVLQTAGEGQTYKKLINQANNADGERETILQELQKLIVHLPSNSDLLSALQKKARETNLIWPDDEKIIWKTITRVWASLWNEQAFLSRTMYGIPQQKIDMAILVQEVIEADYAFVIHTVHPSTNDRNELYAEIVKGLGETLVGNYPGRAMGFSFNKKEKKSSLMSFPSKSHGLYGKGLIFRSDSNAEDLGDYSGAGLYDSHLFASPEKVLLNYQNDPLVNDSKIRNQLFSTIAEIGLAVENCFHTPQDVEGVISKGQFYVVQTRPQVGSF